MTAKKTQKKVVDVSAVKELQIELAAFHEAFDSTDPEGMEVMLSEHISILIKKGFVKPRKGRRTLHLADVLSYILKIGESDGMLENAQMFENLISSYGGEPSDDDMDEAFEILAGLVADLDRLSGIQVADAQKRLEFDGNT